MRTYYKAAQSELCHKYVRIEKNLISRWWSMLCTGLRRLEDNVG